MKHSLVLLSALLLAPAASALAAGPSKGASGKLVCWTDEKGQRNCGDRVPPQYVKGEREVLDAQGRVIEKKSRQKTPEEIAAEEAKVAAEKAEAERYDRQSKYDRYLLQTFNSKVELERSRDSRLKALEGQMALNEKSIADTEKTLKGLKDRVEVTKKAGKPADPKLVKQIEQFEASMAESVKARETKKRDHAEITAKFAADIDRYEKLRARQLEIGAAEPAPSPSP